MVQAQAFDTIRALAEGDPEVREQRLRVAAAEHAAGDLARAKALLERVVAYNDGIGRLRGGALAACALAETRADLGELDAALDHARRGARLAEQVRDERLRVKSELLIADLVARTIAIPAELPLGVVTALIGGPYFLYLLRRTRREQGGWG